MAIKNIGYLNKKVSKKGNTILIGKLNVPTSGEIRVLVATTPSKGGGYSVGLLTDDDQQGGAAGKAEGGHQAAAEGETLFD